MKTCITCSRVFTERATKGDCKSCYAKKYRSKNRAALIQKQKEARKNDPERFKAIDRKKYLKRREQALARRKEYIAEQKEKFKHLDPETQRQKTNELQAKRTMYYKRNKEYYQRKWQERYQKFKAEEKARKKAYYETHQSDYVARKRKRDAAKLNRTPKWLTQEQLELMKRVYKYCPDGYDVDHIVPLQGKNVSGLHVPWNLQYLPELENARKSNKHESDQE